MAEPIPEAETFIRFRLSEMASRNEHHRFEEIATRIARKRISANIIIATGPVSAGGDQQRDAETYTTRIPDELPHSAGFSASASTTPVVVACTVQQPEKMKNKVLADLAGICAEDADPVSHVAYFSVHPISEGHTHELKRTARSEHGVTLDIFCSDDIATMLAEPDLIWVARHYLDLPSALVPAPEAGPAPGWYVDLLDELRRNGGPAALTPATQGEVSSGLRHATWDEDANADLPEWLDFMGAFLADSDDGEDSELVFRACYEMTVARFRGMGVAAGVEDLVRRALEFAGTSDRANVVDDAVTLTSYWGNMWITGVGRADATEISAAVERLRLHLLNLIERTNPSTHPVRSVTLTGTLAFLHLTPGWQKAERQRGRPARAQVAQHVGVMLDEHDVDASALADFDLIDVDAAMEWLGRLVDLLPRARSYSVSQLARLFTMFAPLMSEHPAYVKVRDGLDAAVARTLGQSATAERCRDRAMAFMKSGKPLEALLELHSAKVNWFNGDTLFGLVLTLRFIGKLFGDLKLMYAAKMYALTAATIALTHNDDDLKPQVPKALLEAARHSQHAGCWVDAAGLTEVALLARAQFLTDPFDFEKDPDLEKHHANAVMELGAVRQFWPELEPLITEAHDRTEWADLLVSDIEGAGTGFRMTEREFQQAAAKQLAGPVLGDIGPDRIVDFEALGVRWIFTYSNDRTTVLSAEALVAAFQVFLADVATHHPVLIKSTVHVDVTVRSDAGHEVDNFTIDDSEPELVAEVVFSADSSNDEARERFMIAACFQLLHTVHVRPPAELQELMGPMFKAGLSHKLFVGRPYEEVAALLDDQHYTRCATASRPMSSNAFNPVAPLPLAASTRTGPGYDRDKVHQLIRERYQRANAALRHTLPRLLADENRRAAILRMKEARWLDWQILVALFNAAWNWRMQNAGLRLDQENPPPEAMRLAKEPETPESPEIPIDAFSDDILATHLFVQSAAVAKRWDLRGRHENLGEDALRELLIRRYHYDTDDLPHRDLLDSLDEDGLLRPFSEEGADNE